MEYISLPFALLSLLPIFTLASETCYKLNGDAAYKDFIPCNLFSGATSFCCGANRENTNATYTNDVCLTNGLCISVVEVDGVEEYNYYRESCSSTDWPTASCLRNVCTTPDENDTNGNALMTPCDNTTYSETWCCGKNNTDCCGTDSAITLAVTLGATATLSSTTSSATSTASAISTGSAAATTTASASTSASTSAASSSSASSSTSLSSGAQAGIGVGVAVGALAAIGSVILWYVRRRRTARTASSMHSDSNLMGGAQSPDAGAAKEVYVRPMELDNRNMRHEMEGNGLGELQGDNAFKQA